MASNEKKNLVGSNNDNSEQEISSKNESLERINKLRIRSKK